ncbi:hypothetical protein M426DRAFT_83640 [Hypoxylon sp. CI-4A]|nr:hypothetical protein M426DRAFT_83640 [Hypoxylon sp. CI-4A]
MVLLCAVVRLSHQTITFHAINRASKKASRITHPRLNSSTTIRSHLQLLFYAIFSRKTAPLYQLFTRSQPTTYLFGPVGPFAFFDSRSPRDRDVEKKATPSSPFPPYRYRPTADPHRQFFWIIPVTIPRAAPGNVVHPNCRSPYYTNPTFQSNSETILAPRSTALLVSAIASRRVGHSTPPFTTAYYHQP